MSGHERKGPGRPISTERSRASGATPVQVLLTPPELQDLDASLLPTETRAEGLRRRAGLTRSNGEPS